ncbi:MAG: hypothetical protein P8J87_03135, partial [Verrucomicrobiales bacterium]|nr:hypothetical protein [Verrucomicrobiales bacterium]
MPRTSRSIITLLVAYLYIPVAILALALLSTAAVPHSRYFALALVFLSPTLFCFASDNQKTLRCGTLPFL